VPVRKKALSSAQEEWSKIVDCVSKYALRYSGKSFTLRKEGENVATVATQMGASVVDNIRSLFGSCKIFFYSLFLCGYSICFFFFFFF